LKHQFQTARRVRTRLSEENDRNSQRRHVSIVIARVDFAPADIETEGRPHNRFKGEKNAGDVARSLQQRSF
jgi:hypothetical protein